MKLKTIIVKTYKYGRKFLSSSYFKNRLKYTIYYDKYKINDKEILFQSYDGSSISGNPYYMLLEVKKNKEYNDYKKYVVAKKETKRSIKEFLKTKEMDDVEVVIVHSKKYMKLLARTKYLINNATFPTYFIKKEGQIYLNTWHGTPLKMMGKNIKNSPTELGNTQRNFMMADYLLYPNDFTYQHMKDDYMLDNLFKGKYVLSGYPRNSAFFDDKSRKKIREKLDLLDKNVAIYMPTWRGSLSNKNVAEQYHFIMQFLYSLDRKIDDNVIIFVKLHNYVSSKIDFSDFDKIKPFPKEYETYEFLNIADTLITDYSSVFFDYSNTGRKIILYGYDKEEYLSSRGMYIDYNKLPFIFVDNIESLVKEINQNEKYKKYDSFIKEYNSYDSQSASSDLLNLIFHNNEKKLKVINGVSLNNKKKNILIFAGAFKQNGLTTALKGLVNNTSRKDYNYILNFYKSIVEPEKHTINDFKNIEYIPIQGSKNYTFMEALCHFLYFQMNIDNHFIQNRFKRIYDREIKRIFPNLEIYCAIHYTGYERQIMHMYQYIPNAKSIMYVHSDLNKEKKLRNNIHYNSSISALKNFDRIVAIRETSYDEIIKYYPDIDKNKIKIAHNLNNIEMIREKAKKDLQFEESTYCNIELSELKKILEDKKTEKIITIGRFSPEKSHDRLINAFNKYQKKNNNSYLIIAGGEGTSFKKTLNMVKEINNGRIILVKLIKNPYPLLYNSDLFILSSLYEGLPMTIMEALILDKPVISTNITGPSEFLSEGYGYLVDNSEKGILQGMLDYKAGKLKNLKKFDAEEFNKKAIKEFEKVLED